MVISMEIKVRVFLDNKLIEPSELHNLTIKSPTVDRIVNEIVDEYQRYQNIKRREDKVS